MKYMNLFCPLNVEHLWDIISEVLDQNEIVYSENKKEVKNEVLDIISILLNHNLIYVGNEWLDKYTLKKWELSNEATIIKIDEMWSENAKYEELYDMVWFGYEDWYKNKIEKQGMTHTTNWKNFVNEKIGNLEEWIEKNRPKEE